MFIKVPKTSQKLPKFLKKIPQFFPFFTEFVDRIDFVVENDTRSVLLVDVWVSLDFDPVAQVARQLEVSDRVEFWAHLQGRSLQDL